MAQLNLRIITPESTLFDGPVQSVQFKGTDGSYGILPNHAPLVTATEPGLVTIKHADGKDEALLVTDGFAEIRNNSMSLICEAGERALDIDVERARAAEQKARDLLSNRAELADEDVLRAETALRRAMARQLVGGRRGSSSDR